MAYRWEMLSMRSVNLYYHQVGIQRINLSIIKQLWGSGLNKWHHIGISTSVKVQSAYIWKTHSLPRTVPQDPTAFMCPIVAPSSTLMPTLSLSTMDVIGRALFMFDHSTSESKALQLPCYICDFSAGHWRWLKSAWDTQNSWWGVLCNKNQNNDDARAKLRGMSYMDSAARRVCDVQWL